MTILATIKSTLQLYDSMSVTLRNTYSSVNLLLKGFESMKDSVGEAFPEAEFSAARAQIQQAEAALKKLDEPIRQAEAAMEEMTVPIQQAETAFKKLDDPIIQAESAMEKMAAPIRQAETVTQQLNTKLQQTDTPIRTAENAQKSFNTSINSGSTSAGNLERKLLNVAAAYVSIQSAEKVLGISDTMTSTKARLDLINDGLQTTKELQDKIYQAAESSRGSYTDMAATVSKLGLLAGDAFNSNNETVKFAELMQKAFTVSGASASESTNAMYQLTQAMAAGKLQGDEFRSIMENAPMLAQAIADYTGLSIGKLKELSSEGAITSEVIKNALFGAGDAIEEKFAAMPMTFSQVWTSFKNKAITAFEPVLDKLSELANSSGFESTMNSIAGGLANMALIALDVYNQIAAIATFVSDNWGLIAPIIWGIVTAMAAYKLALFTTNTVLAIKNTLEGIAAARAALHSGATLIEAAATTTAAGAQVGLNAALLACPLTWIIAIIIIIIALFYIVIGVINKLADTSISATGVIVGALLVAAAFIGNLVIGLLNAMIQKVWTIFVEPYIGLIEWILNAANGGFNSFGDAVSNLIGQIISWFLSLGKVVTKIIDAIFGTDWTSGLSSLQDSVLGWGKNENAITISRDAPTINARFDYSDAWDTGYNAGESLQNSVTGLFDTSSLDFSNLEKYSADTADYSAATADNTSGIADTVELSEEDLKTLRELAELESIQNFVTLTPTVQVSTGDINNNADVDDMINKIEKRLTVEIAASSSQLLGVA